MDEDNPFITHALKTSNIVQGLAPGHEEHEQQDDYESSECSQDSQEGSPEIDDSVREDMSRLENIFHNMGFKFRMIDRIGEGRYSPNHETGLISIAPIDRIW